MARSLITAAAVLAIAASACTISESEATSPTVVGFPPSGSHAIFAAGAPVQAFDSCQDFLDHVKAAAIERVGPYGLDGDFGFPVPEIMFAAEDGAGRITADQAAPSQPFSTTNVQVLGVDEPDVVKTDGERIFVVATGRLYWIDVTTDHPHIAASIPLEGWGQQLFLSGDRLLVMTGAGGYGGPVFETDIAPDGYGYHSPRTVLVEVDVRAPDSMEAVRTLTFDGSIVSSRMTGGVVRLVSQSAPVGFEWSYPEGSGLRAERAATERNKKIIEASTIEQWVPWYVLENHIAGTTADGPLLDCDTVGYPDEFAGLSMLSVMSIDLDEPLTPHGGMGLLAQGDTVYASHDNLYVATAPWRWWPVDARDDDTPEVTTRIHQFDISDPRQARYVASGKVKGTLHSQFSLDEYDGVLRVVVTDNSPWWRGSGTPTTSVVTMRRTGERLNRIGAVGGLGKNEQVYSVRFIGDRGYVVTFRQVDPLYVIDLSNPRQPRVTGELKINGYSAYLHPIGDELILGVGQDATDEGRTTGTQISVFDVSDPANPIRMSRLTFDGAYSDAEWDHHAFLWWAPEDLAVIPMQRWGWDELAKSDRGFSGAVAVRATSQSVEAVGEITHRMGDSTCDACDEWSAPIMRSLVIGDTIYTVSQNGVMASDLTTLDEVAWLGF